MCLYIVENVLSPLHYDRATPCGAARASRPRGVSGTRPALPLAYPWRSSQRHGHLTRSRPQDSTSSAAAPQWEPRKPLVGTRKPRRCGDASGAKVIWGLVRCRTTYKAGPFRSVTQADSVDGWRLPGAFTLPRVKRPSALARILGLCRPTPAKPGQCDGPRGRVGRLGLHIVRIEPIEVSFPLVTPWKT